MAALDLRPLSLGELLDRTFFLYRRHFLLFVGIAAMPQLIKHLDPAAVGLLLAGGVLYTVGAVVYARRRPNPKPTVFGYHEVFHALTIVAVACQYVAIAFFIVHAG